MRLLAISLGVVACTGAAKDPPAELPVVGAETVGTSGAATGVRYSAVLKANRQVELDFKLAGYVRQLGRNTKANRALQEGDRVQAGTMLAAVDAADYTARLDTARTAVAEAAIASKQAERDRNRASALVSSGAMSPVELEMTGTQADAAAARLGRAQATLHEAELAVSDTTLRAPFAGVILNRFVEQGAFVTARTPGYVLADTTTMKVVFGVPDTVAQAVRIGQGASVEIPSLGRSFAAPVSRVSPSADPRSRLFELEVTLPNEEQALKVGLAATVVLGTSASEKVGKSVPLRALIGDSTEPHAINVFVLDKGAPQPTVRARAVTIKSIVGDDAVVDGLDGYDRVITLGAALLRDGERVRLIR